MKKNTIRLRIGNEHNGEQGIKVLISHPMETGLRKDRRTGGKIPADYIEDVQVSIDGKKTIELTLGENVSKNPFIAFTFAKPVVNDQKMEIRWTDNNARQTSYDFVVKFDAEGFSRFSSDAKGVEVEQLAPKIKKPVCNSNASKWHNSH